MARGSAAPWATVMVVVGAGIVTALQVGKAAIATPQLQAELGLGLAAAGWLTGIFAVLGVVGGIPAGALVARIGDRAILVTGLAAAALGAALGALAPGYYLLLGSRLLEGLGFLLITVAGPAILGRLVPAAQRNLAFALWSCFMPAGMALAMSVGPQFGHWRGLWWASGALAAAAMAGALALIPSAPDEAAAPPARLAALASRAPVLLALCFALYSLMFFALFSFLPVLLMEHMDIRHALAGQLAALAAGVNISGNLAAGYFLGRGASRFVLLALACIVMGLAALCIFLQPFGAAQTLAMCMLFSAVGGLIPATLISSAPLLARSPAQAPLVLGLLMQGSALGQIVGPVAVGGAIQAHGWQAAAWIVPGAALAAIGAAAAAGGVQRTQ